ncbi:MAG: choice-of-anchor Q domain-containing protein, partial [Pseudomonadota bacterium]
MNQKRFALIGLLLTGLLASTTAHGGGNVCVTIASGNWSDPIWDCGGSNTTPSEVDDVTIGVGHTVLLDQDVTINTLFIEPGGDFNVGPSANDLELEVEQSGSDLSNAIIDLFGDFTIRANVPGATNVDITLGAIDGAFDFRVFSDDDITILGALGANTPLASYQHDSLGVITLTRSITTTGNIVMEGETRIAAPVDLFAQNIFLIETIDADLVAADCSLTMTAAQEVHWDSTIVGSFVPLQSLTVTAPNAMNMAGNARTTGAQDYNVDLNLRSNLTLTGSQVTFNGELLSLTGSATGFNMTVNGNAQFNTSQNPTSNPGVSLPVENLTVTGEVEFDMGGAGTVTTSSAQTYQGAMILNNDMAFGASQATFGGVVISANGGAFGFDVIVTGDARFTSSQDGVLNRGSDAPIQLLTVSGNAEFDINGGGSITTIGAQNYQGSMTLNSDVTFNSTGAGNITLRNSGGPHQITMNTTGTTTFAGTIGAPAHASITTNAGGLLICANGTVINVDSTTVATTFNDTLRLGSSQICTINQLGGADIVFNGPIAQTGGGPKRLFVNDVSGRTVFNNTVELGVLTTNDGLGDDVTVINTNSFRSVQGGSNNGFLTFNDPVQILQNVTFAPGGNGRLIFNNTVDEGPGATGSNVIINSGTQTRLGPVGTLIPIDSLTTDGIGSTQINGDVRTDIDQFFNDPVFINAPATVAGTNLNFNSTVDLQVFDLTLEGEDADLEAPVSGSGNLISNIGLDLDVNANNVYTGQTLIQSGTLDLQASPTANALSFSPQIALASGTILRPNGGDNIFELQNTQTLSGTGLVQGNLIAQSGSIIRPGDNLGDGIGSLTGQEVALNGATLAVQLQGNARGSEPDRLIVDTIVIVPSASLDVEVTAAPSPGESFRIIEVATSLGGTFNGLPEGAFLTAPDGSKFGITYQGGDGNDVVLEFCADLIEVNSIADGGPGSLREAVAGVCPGGTITFAAGFFLALNSEIQVDKAFTIDGGLFDVEISGSETNRVFNITSTGDLTLNRVTVSDGRSGSPGGGIFNAGTLSIIDSFLTNNETTFLGKGGGAIYNEDSAVLTIERSTFTDNQAARGGAIFNNLNEFAADGVLTITNSTFSGNGTAALEGGAIHNRGTMTVTNSTIANNGAAGALGGGTYTWNGDQTLINTIVADNTGNGDCRIDLGNSTESNTASLLESGNCDAALTDDPQLQSLADNGGSTQTLALDLRSPAVNAGDNGLCPATDQRSVARPQLGDCDIGAYEQENLAVIYVNENALRLGPPCNQGACWGNPYFNLQDALAIAVSGAEVWVAQGVYYPDIGAAVANDDPTARFTLPSGVSVYGGFNGTETEREERAPEINVTILSGDIDNNDTDGDGNQIAESVSDIQGTNAYNVVALGNPTGTVIVLDGFTITAGSALGNAPDEQTGGGIVCPPGPIANHLFNAMVWIGNQASSGGGALARCNGTITNSAFIANASANVGGAAIFEDAPTLENVEFINNSATLDGGAIIGDDLIADRVLFLGNQAGSDGGAVSLIGAPTITNSLFSGNVSGARGGALYARGEGVLSGVTLTANRSTQAGGAMFYDPDVSRGGDFLFLNSVIWNNEDVNGIGTISIVTLNGPSAAVSFNHTLYQGSGGSTNWNPLAGNDSGGNIDT